MQAVPKFTVRLTPDQGLTGRGAFHLRAPTGGAAKGIPLNSEIPSTTVPEISPPVTFAVAISAIAGDPAARASAARQISNWDLILISSALAPGLVRKPAAVIGHRNEFEPDPSR
jgi:hypothetical protein